MKLKESHKEFKEIIGKSMKANERNSKFVKYENTMSHILCVDMCVDLKVFMFV